jgi:ubiquinone/menaquinone biosynthesis C-methylase UbiE
MIDKNRTVYRDCSIANKYKESVYLDKPEIAFFYKFENKLKAMKMLDIGVGGGRTTHYFAHRVKSYVGIDYSENMVKVCQNRFPDLDFFTCDARNMGIFQKDHFDLVLFSFNGIDYVSHEDRLNILREIRRVCKKPGGIFFFSSHNLDYVPNLFLIKYSLDPFIMFYNLYRYALLSIMNRNIECNRGYAVINDGALNFKLLTYYITQNQQVAQLNDIGFKTISIYSLDSGMDLKEESKNASNPWLHYLCES